MSFYNRARKHCYANTTDAKPGTELEADILEVSCPTPATQGQRMRLFTYRELVSQYSTAVTNVKDLLFMRRCESQWMQSLCEITRRRNFGWRLRGAIPPQRKIDRR